MSLAAGQSRTIPLNPRACGQLELNVLIDGKALTAERVADYQVKGDGVDRSGALPLAAPLVLPAGTYQVQVNVERCTTFRASLNVAGGKVTQPSIRSMCD